MTDLDFMVLDGGTLSEFLAVPVIVAAWILVVVFLDRWVPKHADFLATTLWSAQWLRDGGAGIA